MRIPGTTPTKKIPGAWPGIRNLAGLERDSVPAGTPIELVVHADLGNRELVLEIRVHSDGWRPDDPQRRKVDGVRLALAVEFDVVVLDEGGPVRSDHVLAAGAATGGAFTAISAARPAAVPAIKNVAAVAAANVFLYSNFS